MRIVRQFLAAVALVFLASTGLSATAEAQQRGGILEYGIKAEPETYDVHATNAYGVMHYLPQHYSTLLTFNWDNFPEIVGDVATSWDVSDDNLTYTFKLREGIEFHDGTPLTAEDVKASYDRMRNPPEGIISARQALFESIDTIETPDDRTVVFRMKEVDASMLQNFAGPYNVIYAAKDIAKPGNWHHSNVNGTGPFVFVEYVAGEKWVTKRYENYHFDDVYLDGTVAYRIKDIANPMAGGQIMAEFRSVSPPERKNLKEMMGDKVAFQEEPMLSKMMVTLNSDFEPFKDKRVRQALNLCVDRYEGLQNLAKITWTSPAVSGHLLPGSEWALPQEELEQLPGFGRDIEANRKKARELLKEAGHEGLEFTYSNRAVSHPYDQIAIFLISQWRQCGINPKMESNPTATWAEKRRNGGFDATIDFNSNVLVEPTQMLQKHISADRSPQNYSGYTDRELDALFDAQRKEADPAKRKELVQAFEKRNLEQAWTVPVSFMSRTIPLHAKVKGYKIAPSLMLNTNWRGVWIEQ